MASSRSLTAKLDDARRLSLRDIGWFLQAWFCLPMVRRKLNRDGLKQTLAKLDVESFSASSRSAEDAGRLARMVQAAANHHVFSIVCLPQSVWIWSRLRRLGIPCEIKLGVNPQGPHAWVEVDGQRLNEPGRPELQATPFESVASTHARGDA